MRIILGVNYNLPLSEIHTRINSWSRFSEVKRLRIPARRATFWVVVVPRWLWTVCTNADRTTLTVIRYPLYVESALSRMSSLGTYIPQLTRKMNTSSNSYAHTDGRIHFKTSWQTSLVHQIVILSKNFKNSVKTLNHTLLRVKLCIFWALRQRNGKLPVWKFWKKMVTKIWF